MFLFSIFSLDDTKKAARMSGTVQRVEIVIYKGGPKDTNFLGDIYVDGKRRHCGDGYPTDSGAMQEAIGWLELANEKAKNKQQMPCQTVGKKYLEIE